MGRRHNRKGSWYTGCKGDLHPGAKVPAKAKVRGICKSVVKLAARDAARVSISFGEDESVTYWKKLVGATFALKTISITVDAVEHSHILATNSKGQKCSYECYEAVRAVKSGRWNLVTVPKPKEANQ